MLASALVFGLAVGVAATIFGYSNTGTVTVGFALWHAGGVPLWSVALVPLAIALVVGTLYHWWNSLHHFTEHMRHRRRVRDLEAQVSSLKEHLDHLLEMPDHGATPARAMAVLPSPDETEDAAEALPELEPEVVAATPPPDSNGNGGASRPPAARKRGSLKAAAATNGEHGAPTLDSTEAPNS